MAAARLVRIKDPDSVSSALRKNGHGGDKYLGTANISASRKRQKETENLHRGAAAGHAKGTGSGRQGAGQRWLAQWPRAAPSVSETKTTEVRQKYDVYDTS